jgi:hypothetical protein
MQIFTLPCFTHRPLNTLVFDNSSAGECSYIFMKDILLTLSRLGTKIHKEPHLKKVSSFLDYYHIQKRTILACFVDATTTCGHSTLYVYIFNLPTSFYLLQKWSHMRLLLFSYLSVTYLLHKVRMRVAEHTTCQAIPLIPIYK